MYGCLEWRWNLNQPLKDRLNYVGVWICTEIDNYARGKGGKIPCWINILEGEWKANWQEEYNSFNGRALSNDGLEKVC